MADAAGRAAEIAAHEFHYSRLENVAPDVRYAYRVLRGTASTAAGTAWSTRTCWRATRTCGTPAATTGRDASSRTCRPVATGGGPDCEVLR